jgi:hypothetical protein
MFLGVEAALHKYMLGLAAALIAFLFAKFGKSMEEPLGVLLIGPIAAAAGLASTVLFTLLPKGRVDGSAVSEESASTQAE